MKFAPKAVYNSIICALRFSQSLWEPESKPFGGGDVSGAGIPETFLIRRDQLANVVLTFFEDEWPAVRAWLQYGQTGQAFDFWFDQSDIATKYTVYLDTPNFDASIKPKRGTARYTYTLDITLRTVNGTPFDVIAYPDMV